MSGVRTKVWELFRRELFPIATKANLFNPYTDSIPGVDVAGAAEIRRQNLEGYLRCFLSPPAVVLVGEAPGWRGCRFSGVPFTSEAQLVDGSLPFSGRPSSARLPPYKEATASIFWRTVGHFHPQFFAWNCLPFHPHRPGKPSSNRAPTTGEITAHAGLLASLLALLGPRCVVAIGRRAEQTLGRIGVPAVYVRHPSHGGAKAFASAVTAILQSHQPPERA